MYLRGSTLEPTCERTRGSRVGECHLGIDRPPRSAEPGLILVQVHLDMVCPLLILIPVDNVFMLRDGGNRASKL